MASDGLDIRAKQIFSTGEAAKICNVSQQTIIRCFDSGELEGFRVPGSRFRRIPREALLRFMQNHGMVTTAIDDDCTRILIIDDDDRITKPLIDLLEHDARFDVKSASTGFQAGVLTEQFKPQLMVLNVKVADVDATQIVPPDPARPRR